MMENLNITDVMKGQRTVITYPGIMNFRFNVLSGNINRLFAELDLLFLVEPVLVVIKETLTNAAKANAKRIYFESQQLDIQDPEVYNRHIQDFAMLVTHRWDEFLAKYEPGKYKIELIFEKSGEDLTVTVYNNALLLNPEKQRIKERIEYFKKINSMERAFEEMRDEQEGTGLGLILSLYLLRKSGIHASRFFLRQTEDGVITGVRIPLQNTHKAITRELRDRVLSKIQSLPSLPDRVSHLLKLFESDHTSMMKIATEIEKDPGLTAQLLKMVYSAGYLNRLKNPTITDAVKIIGLNPIKNLILVYGSRSVMSSRFSSNELEEIWENSNRVSYFARRIASGNRMVEETAPIAGLLHELGRIVLSSMEPALIQSINGFLGEDRIRNTSTIEEIELGISHPEVGALLAEKWNFPEPLIEAIRYQQKPHQATGENAALVNTVYLAIRMQETTRNIADFYYVEPEILEAFQLNNEHLFNEKVESLMKEYENYLKELEEQ